MSLFVQVLRLMDQGWPVEIFFVYRVSRVAPLLEAASVDPDGGRGAVEILNLYECQRKIDQKDTNHS